MRPALLAALLSLILAAPAQAFSTHPELDATASWLAQRPAEVRCYTQEEADQDVALTLFGAAAYVDVTPDGPSEYTVFSPGLCEKLLSIRDGSWRGRYSLSALAWAVLVLTHESGHLRGWAWWTSEAKTNCWALRHVRYTALRLGASDDLSLGIRSWAVYWYRQQPPEYRLAGCRIPFP